MMTSVRVLLATFACVVFASAVHAQNPVLGTWDFNTSSPEGEFKSTLVIREEGGKLVRWAAVPIVSALRATPSMDVVISSTVAEVSVTVPARFSRLRAIWSMETVICSMVAEASVTVEARVELDFATCSMDAPIWVIELEVSST